jgi:hypothetical protein
MNAALADDHFIKRATASGSPYYVKGLALGIPAYLIGIHLWTWVFMLSAFLGGRADFRQLYTSGFMVSSGYARQLYDYDIQLHFQNKLVSKADIALPGDHPAYEALLFVPLSLLRYRTAYFVFVAVNVGVLALVFWMLHPHMENLTAIFWWLPVAMFLGFLPAAAALMQGQDSILLLFLLAAAMIALNRGQELTAGALVGLGLFKFQIVIPIALLFFVWRRWRFSAGFTFSTGAVAGISLWLVGFAQAKVYARSLVSMSVSLSSILDQFKYGIYPSAMPNLRGLLFGVLRGRVPGFWLQTVTIAVSAAAFILVAILAKKQLGEDLFLIAITVGTLVSYHVYIHDLSVLLIPVIVTLNRFIQSEKTGDKAERWAARTAAGVFVAPVCKSFAPDHFYLVSIVVGTFLGSIMWALIHADPVPQRPQMVGSAKVHGK